jgi:hypothetical protein
VFVEEGSKEYWRIRGMEDHPLKTYSVNISKSERIPVSTAIYQVEIIFGHNVL